MLARGLSENINVDLEASSAPASAFFENLKQFYPVHASAKQYTLKGSLAGPTIPFHPGAIRYYKEIGAWTEALAKTQQALLDSQ